MIVIEKTVDYLLKNELISEADRPWLHYALEKRFLTYIFLLPITLLGILLTNTYITIVFLTTYFFIRGMANGFHAKTRTGCFVLSVCIEFIFLGLIYPKLTEHWAAVLFASSLTILFFFAPYNHPNMHLTATELDACRSVLRKRLIFIGILFIITYYLHSNNIVFGISIGVTMASSLLCLAYISKWRLSWKIH